VERANDAIIDVNEVQKSKAWTGLLCL